MRISKSLIKAYSRMSQKGAFSGIGMIAAMEAHGDILAVVADSVSIASLDRFQNLYPDRVVNVGIAEQNMIGVASGLASEGQFQVFAFTYAEFLTLRAYEQIRQNLSYQQFNVKLVGNSAGFSMGPLGVSHWATEDIALMLALPGIQIFSAADSLAAVKIAEAVAQLKGPAYVRLSGGMDCPIVYESDFEFVIGKAMTLAEGDDAAIVATGMMVREALDASRILAEKGIRCAVVDMHTIRPLDYERLDELFKRCALIATVEEHSKVGGLGGAVAQYKAERNAAVPLAVLGAEQRYARLGSPRYIWRQHGLTAEQIADEIENRLRG